MSVFSILLISCGEKGGADLCYYRDTLELLKKDFLADHNNINEENLNKFEKYAKKVNDKEYLFYNHFFHGEYFRRSKKELVTALRCYIKAKNIDSTYSNKLQILYLKLGLTWSWLGDYAKSNYYYFKGLDVSKSSDSLSNSRNILKYYGNIGNNYKFMKETEKAEYYYNLSYSLCKEKNYINLTYYALNNMIALYIDKDEYSKVDSLLK